MKTEKLGFATVAKPYLIPSAYKLPLNNTVPVTKQNATRLAHVDETTPDNAGKRSKANA